MRPTTHCSHIAEASTVASLAEAFGSPASHDLPGRHAASNKPCSDKKHPPLSATAVLVACLTAATVSAQTLPRGGVLADIPIDAGSAPRVLERGGSTFHADDINPFTNQTIQAERLNHSVQTARQRTRLLEQEVAAERLRVELHRLRLGQSGSPMSLPGSAPQDARNPGASGPVTGRSGTHLTHPDRPEARSSQRAAVQSIRSGRDRSPRSPETPAPGASMGLEVHGAGGRPTTELLGDNPTVRSAAGPGQMLALPRVVGTAESGGRRYALIDTGRDVEVIAEGTQRGTLQVQRIAEGRVTLNGITTAPVLAQEIWPAPAQVSTIGASPMPARMMNPINPSEARGAAWGRDAGAAHGAGTPVITGLDAGRRQEP